MKDNIANVLEDFEKLAYKILMWVILVPKTIIKVTLDPGFVPGYVRGELASEKGKQFDEYISPMLLYLGVTLIPAIAIYFIPVFGISVETPQNDPTLRYNAYIFRNGEFINALNQPGEFIPLTGEGNIKATSDPDPISYYQVELRAEVTTKGDIRNNVDAFYWEVWVCGNLNSDGACSYDTFLFGQVHDQEKGLSNFGPDEYGTPIEIYRESSQYTIIEDDTSRNRVLDSFLVDIIPVESLVIVKFANYDPDTPERLLEYYESKWVVTPSNAMPPGVSYKEYNVAGNKGSDVVNIPGLGFYEVREVGESNEERIDLAKRLESSDTIILGLLLLLPPLLLATVVGIFTGADRSFGEESLKEHFYAQCYYFVPVGMAFWASYYSINFHANDVLLPQRVLFIPLIMAMVWFVVVEIYSIADELENKSKVRALLMFLSCVLLMGGVLYVRGEFLRNYDLVRISSIWAYPIVGLLLVLGVIYNQTKKIRKRRKKV
jgi:hypothetical protein